MQAFHPEHNIKSSEYFQSIESGSYDAECIQTRWKNYEKTICTYISACIQLFKVRILMKPVVYLIDKDAKLQSPFWTIIIWRAANKKLKYISICKCIETNRNVIKWAKCDHALNNIQAKWIQGNIILSIR